ncbi:hypothetical protein NDU88_001570 [Pleurodeles waltl]|uniref:Dispersed gene family protein 1 (DGF-1) n=1 Tax=Pleurodeles waltl TaxID=8319 RepID=A0AAV7WMJ1_PLEWA|nr:hypothetical protein NDU88_001570 [Pleurodeles waltl]
MDVAHLWVVAAYGPVCVYGCSAPRGSGHGMCLWMWRTSGQWPHTGTYVFLNVAHVWVVAAYMHVCVYGYEAPLGSGRVQALCVYGCGAPLGSGSVRTRMCLWMWRASGRWQRTDPYVFMDVAHLWVVAAYGPVCVYGCGAPRGSGHGMCLWMWRTSGQWPHTGTYVFLNVAHLWVVAADGHVCV